LFVPSLFACLARTLSNLFSNNIDIIYPYYVHFNYISALPCPKELLEFAKLFADKSTSLIVELLIPFLLVPFFRVAL